MDEFFDKLLKELECILKTAVAERMDDGFLPQYSDILNQVVDVRDSARVPHIMPIGSCIYIYTFFADGAVQPSAVYVGQTKRNIYTRLHEHLRGKRRKSDVRINQLLNDCTLHIFCLPAAKKYLDDLEAASVRWLNENAIGMEMINIVDPGHNNSVKKGTKEKCIKVCLPRITDLGDRKYALSLNAVAQDLDDLENRMTDDELKDIDALATIISSNEDIKNELQNCQSVSTAETGTMHILTGGKIMLAARRAGCEQAFGSVVICYNMSVKDGYDRRTKQEVLFTHELRSNLPKSQFDKLADIGRREFLQKHPENDRTGTHYVKLEGVASLIVTNCPSKTSIKKCLKTYEFSNKPIELMA